MLEPKINVPVRFNLLETSNQAESVEFLAAATECLKKKYEGRRLYSKTVAAGEEEGDVDPQQRGQRDDYVLPTFESFNEAGKKRKPLKAWEVFARMLMQVGTVHHLYISCGTLCRCRYIVHHLFISCGTLVQVKNSLERLRAWAWHHATSPSVMYRVRL